jgi:hypothetical protein
MNELPLQKNWEFCQRELSQLKELGDGKRQNECGTWKQ